MLYPLLILTLIALGTGFNVFFLKPKRKISQFCDKARKAGYKVKEIPFSLFDFFAVRFMKQDDGSFKIFKEQLKEYDLIVGNLFTRLSIIPNHPAILKDIFSQTNKVQKDPLFVNIFKILFKGGIPLAEGQEWKRKRRMISSLFHFDFINQMQPLIEDQTQKEMEKIDRKISSGENVNILKSCFKIFSTVIMKCFFEADVNQHMVGGKPYPEFFLGFLNDIGNYIQSYEQLAFGMIPYNYGLTKRARSLKKNILIIYNIAVQIVDKQLKKLNNGQFTQKNLLTILYQNDMFNQTNTYDPNKYTKEELIGQFFSFFAAGSDTTSNTLNLILHYLSQNEKYLEKITDQIKQLASIEGPQKLKQMKWTDAFINQTLRVGGPAAVIFSRHVVQHIIAGGLQIPKDTSMNILLIMNQLKGQYFEEPFQFNPERWMQDKSIQPFAYIPFSTGERSCIGQYLAKTELKTVLAKIIQKYKFKAMNPIKMRYDFIYTTKNGDFQMQIKS